MSRYDHRAIEAKWQERWEEEGLGRVQDLTPTPSPQSRRGVSEGRREAGEKSYVLVEFPYPSGDGLHVGHVRSYTALDAVVRKRRMEGKNVLFPIGWDAFGLPTENYALKTGVHPREATDKNIANFRRQMKSLGLSFDWSREVDTTDPMYYKWTQWIFLKLLKAGLAYQATIPISWCPKDKIGLANEEVIGGKCERCGTIVERRMQKQWMLKITAYADRLLKDLDTVDYSERIKTQQQNWIGRSEGAEVRFEIPVGSRVVLMHGKDTDPGQKWYPWFVDELQSKGFSVDAPALPHADDPVLDEWLKELDALAPDGETVLVGHSRGGVAILRWLERLPAGKKVKKVILVATNRGDANKPSRGFFTGVYDFKKIRSHCSQFVVLHSHDDEWVPFEDGEHIAKGLEAKIYPFDDRGHFGKKVSTILELLNEIEILKQPRSGVRGKVRDDNVQTIVTVFTTRPDTLFGATYLVLSPEHPLVDVITAEKQKKAIAQYKKKVAHKSDLERTSLEKEKTGVFTGAYAVNPVNNEKIPVWIADYVLMSYGTGAIMAVPAHDERDHEFATKFKLPIREVIVPEFEDEGSKRQAGKPTVIRKTVYALLRNPKDDTYLCLDWNDYYWNTLIIGGVNGDDLIEAAKKEIAEETGYINVRHVRSLGRQIGHYYAAHKKENRVADAVGLLFDLLDEKRIKVKQEELKKHTPKWLTRDEVGKFLNISSQRYAWERYLSDEEAYVGKGVMVNGPQRFDSPVPRSTMEGMVASPAAYGHLGNELEAVGYTEPYDGLPSDDFSKRIIGWLEKNGKGKRAVNYKLRDWVFSRQHYWGEPIPVVHCEKCKNDAESTKWKLNFYESPWHALQSGEKSVETRALNPEEKERYFSDIKVGDIIEGTLKGTDEKMYLRVMERNVLKNLKELHSRSDLLERMRRDYKPTLAELEKDYAFTPDYVERIEKYGLVAWKVERVIPGIVSVPEDQLPVKLPEVEKYQPTGTGESPLAAIATWVNTTCPKCGGRAKRETDTMPNWAGSSWYFLRYCDPKNNKELASMKKLKYWMPVDLYNGGMEHTTLHLLYSRFWHKFLYDQGFVPTSEPYQKRVSHGMVLASDGRKMSKSFGNVINPDELVEQYGADSVRLYEMFMGPFEDAIPWDEKGIVGMRRFLDKVWRIGGKTQAGNCPHDVVMLTNQTIKKVTNDLEQFHFNTAISALMILANAFEKLEKRSREEFEYFLLLLEPFAPHISREILEQLGRGNLKGWPKSDDKLLKELSEVTIVMQVNGKLRGTLTMPAGAMQKDVEYAAQSDANVKKYLMNEPKKVIFVKDRLINFVV